MQQAPTWPTRLWASQLAVFCAVIALVTMDNLLAFMGGVVIGVALRQWIIPVAQDWLDARELSARLRRRPKRGR